MINLLSETFNSFKPKKRLPIKSSGLLKMKQEKVRNEVQIFTIYQSKALNWFTINLIEFGLNQSYALFKL